MSQPHPQSAFKIEAFFNEFPFLTNGDEPLVPDPSRVTRVRVSRISEELMGFSPLDTITEGFICGSARESVLALDKNGQVIDKVKPAKDYGWRTGGEFVGQTIARLGNPEEIHFVVFIRRVRTWDQDGDLSDNSSVTIYKPPKNFTLRAWVDEYLQRKQSRSRPR